MAATIASFATDPECLEASLRGCCACSPLIIGRGQFRARFTKVVLPRVSLLYSEEWLPRIGFFLPPPDAVVIVLPFDRQPAQCWAGVPLFPHEFLTLHGGPGIHARTLGYTHSLLLCCSVSYLRRVGRRLESRDFSVPAGVVRWHPPANALMPLTSLLRGVLRVSSTTLNAPAEIVAGHGLEQQLIEELVNLLSASPPPHNHRQQQRRTAIMAALENLVQASGDAALSQGPLCSELGVAARTLRAYCKEVLGIAPRSYVALHRLHAIRRALLSAEPGEATLSRLVRQHGFRQPGRFAGYYRRHFGELPSVAFGKRCKPRSDRDRS